MHATRAAARARRHRPLLCRAECLAHRRVHPHARPEEITEDIHGRYTDLNIYGTVNFTNNVGVQAGYRKFDVGYKIEDDTGAFKLNGLYFGIVARY